MVKIKLSSKKENILSLYQMLNDVDLNVENILSTKQHIKFGTSFSNSSYWHRGISK